MIEMNGVVPATDEIRLRGWIRQAEERRGGDGMRGLREMGRGLGFQHEVLAGRLQEVGREDKGGD